MNASSRHGCILLGLLVGLKDVSVKQVENTIEPDAKAAAQKSVDYFAGKSVEYADMELTDLNQLCSYCRLSRTYNKEMLRFQCQWARRS